MSDDQLQTNNTNNQTIDDQSLVTVEEELLQAKKAQEDLLAQTQRTLADYANLKKRFEREREEFGKFAAEMTFMQLLPAIDNLERAVTFATVEDQKTTIYQGVKMTLQQLNETLSQVGLKQIKSNVGDTFDPHQHEAIDAVKGPKDQIVEILSSGYSLHDKVIRPTRVKVGNGQEAAKDSQVKP